MRIIILGGTGRIGSAVAYDLVRNNAVNTVGVTGMGDLKLEKMASKLNSNKLNMHKVDLENQEAVTLLLRDYDAAIITLPNRRLSYKAIECAINAGTHAVDILEEYHRRPEPHETEGLEVPGDMSLEKYGESLHDRAMKSNVTILDGMGFAPGLSNITTQYAIDYLDKAVSAIARVGGIPSKETSLRHPLKYLITWSFEHVLREYMVSLSIRKNGKVVQVQALEDHEIFEFTEFGKNDKLECFITPGMPSFIYTHPELDYFTEKTIRWPGHWQGIQTLKECGLLETTPVEFQGSKISPREFMLAQLEPKLRPVKGDADACVMVNTIKGFKDNKECTVEFFMWDEEDKVNNITSMARVTGFSASIAGMMLAANAITQRGIVAPEEVISGELYDKFLKELGKRNIKIAKRIN